jgi:uncharacterized integral membrane protein (TIGR00697 family)
MSNELLLIVSLIFIYGLTLLWWALFGKSGLYAWSAFVAIAANIEVLILVEAFGLEQTLGNILFATTFLTTDILSENADKKVARKAVNIGILTSASFIVVSQLWLLYTPSQNDFAHPHIIGVFTNTPRIMLAGFIVYAIVQRFDVFMYHHLWSLTERKTGNRRRLLWFRNTASTMISQLLNTVLFTLGAFLGTYDTGTLISIMIVTYVVFTITALADTPVAYLARRIHEWKEGRLLHVE